MPVYQIDGLTPVVPEESYVHPTAVLIGDVILGKGVYIGPNASLRGDFGRIVVKDGANIQDNCVMHGFPEQDTVVEEDGHIGHSAILHGCIIRRNALVGMNRRKQHRWGGGVCEGQSGNACESLNSWQSGESDS